MTIQQFNRLNVGDMIKHTNVLTKEITLAIVTKLSQPPVWPGTNIVFFHNGAKGTFHPFDCGPWEVIK